MNQIDQLIADCKMSRSRVLTDESMPEPMRREMANNVWPWLEAFARAMNEELSTVHAEMAMLYVEQETLIDPELGASILGLFEIGRQHALELEQQIKNSGDEVAIKRQVPRLHDYVRASHAVGDAVEAAMARYADADGDEETDAEEEHGDEDGDEQE